MIDPDGVLQIISEFLELDLPRLRFTRRSHIPAGWRPNMPAILTKHEA
jgi:hypothetical protein